MSIVGYWRLNGNSNDASGNGYNMTDTDVTYAQSNGVKNQGGGYNGSSSKSVYDNKISTSNSGTINCWFRVTSNATNISIFGLGGNHSTKGGLLNLQVRYIDPNNYMSVVSNKYNISGSNLIRCNSTIANGKWYMGTLVSDGSAWSMYVDGILQGMTTIAGSNTGDWFGDVVIPEGYMTSIGTVKYNNSITAFFYGAIDDVKVDDAVWSAANIKNDYSRVKGFF